MTDQEEQAILGIIADRSLARGCAAPWPLFQGDAQISQQQLYSICDLYGVERKDLYCLLPARHSKTVLQQIFYGSCCTP